MTETLHWYAETSGGVQTGNCTVTENDGALHLTADLPAGTLKAVRAEMPWTMEADERLFMNGYQTWTYSPELDRNGKLRGTDHIPGFLRKKYAFDRYGDYHFAPYGHQKGQSHGFSYCYFRKGTQFRLVASLDEKPGYTILRYDSGKALLTLERDCAGVEHPGGSFPLLDLFFAEGGETEVFDGWFQAMGIRPRTEKKLAGYSSWYNRYQDITEDTIREDLTGCRSLLRMGDLFQIDDGWGAEGGRLAGNRCTEIPPRAERHGGGNSRHRISGRAMACTLCVRKGLRPFPAAPGLAAESGRQTVVLRQQLEQLLCAGYRQPGRAGLSAPGV